MEIRFKVDQKIRVMGFGKIVMNLISLV